MSSNIDVNRTWHSRPSREWMSCWAWGPDDDFPQLWQRDPDAPGWGTDRHFISYPRVAWYVEQGWLFSCADADVPANPHGGDKGATNTTITLRSRLGCS